MDEIPPVEPDPTTPKTSSPTTHPTTEQIISPKEANTTAQQAYKGTRNTGATRPTDITRETMEAAGSDGRSSAQEQLEDLPQADAEMLDEPRKQSDAARKGSGSHPGKTRQFLDQVKSRYAAGKEKITTLKQQYPRTAKVVEGTAKVAGQHPIARGGRAVRFAWGVIRSIDAEDIKKARDLAVEWGRDIRVFIDDAKQKIPNEEKAAKGKPFHQRQEAQREKEIHQLEREQKWLLRTNKGEYAEWVGEVRFSNAEAIKDTGERIRTLKNTSPSLEEAISRQASRTPVKTDTNRVAVNTDELGKRYLAGSSGAKYDYYLHNANHHLGSAYFDLARHPQRAIEFDRFAATRLYQDGFSRTQVEEAVRGGAFRSHFQETLTRKYLQEYDQRVFGDTIHNNPITERVRDKTIRWQQSQGQRLHTGKINPQEVDQHQTLRDYWHRTNLEKAQTTRHQSLDALEAHHRAGGLSRDSSTDAQYLLEYARWLKAGKTPNEHAIATRLTIAGHPKEEVVEVLRNRSIRHNESSVSLEKEYGLIQKDIFTDKKYAQEASKTEELKANRKDERRLDALQLSYEHREGVYHTTRQVMESRHSVSPSSISPKPQQNGHLPEIER